MRASLLRSVCGRAFNAEWNFPKPPSRWRVRGVDVQGNPVLVDLVRTEQGTFTSSVPLNSVKSLVWG